jgi:hypothetical protein
VAVEVFVGDFENSGILNPYAEERSALMAQICGRSSIMAERTGRLAAVYTLMALLTVASGSAQANWSETFGGNAFDQAWTFGCYPDVTKTCTQTIKDGPDDDDYLRLEETTSFNLGGGSYGSAFGIGFGSPEKFTDVRVGAVVNVTGDSSRNYHGVAARASYVTDPDGSVSGVPGMIASAYIVIFHWEDGPTDVRIEVLKTVNNDDSIMEVYEPEVPVPGLDHARSHYLELDVVGSGPVYVTASIYQYKGGPLLVRTPTMVDTGGNDPWERAGIHDAVFTNGLSGIFVINEDATPAGYSVTFDSVSSSSDGPAAVNPGPVDGATGVPANATLSWVEADFAIGRELWIGKAGAMEKVDPAPTGTTYIAALEFGQTYQWRIDQVGASGTVTGRTWSFTTVDCLAVEDFESYTSDAGIRTIWVDNITDPGVEYVFLGTGENQSLRFEYQNQYPPYYTEATRTFATAQDWTALDTKAVALSFYGERDNVEQPMYLKLEDSSGNAWKVENPYTHACQAERWEDWRIALSEFSDNDVDVSSIKKVTFGTGNGTQSAQPEADADKDFVYIDDIRLCPAGCLNVDQLDLRGDVNGDCKIDFIDFALMADGWLNDGLSAAP